MDESTRSHRIAGLDGLRAIAVLAVLAFHAELPWADGGYLGVDLFFVLSGFLITGLLAGEVESSGRLDLWRFYVRRAKRLLPAVWGMMLVVATVAIWVAPDALSQVGRDGLASLFYLTNWELLSSNTSYFETMGRPPLFQHLWSLAVEEQFYIAWAFVVPLALIRWGRRALIGTTLGLAVASIAWMMVMAAWIGYPDQGEPTRLYFGTDTHGFSLLVGASLGLVWKPAHARTLGGMGRALGVGVGVLAMGCLLAMFWGLKENATFLYPWGLLAAALASAVLIAVASHPHLPLGGWLDNTVLRFLGERSYGIYLWHWPIFMLTRPGLDVVGMSDAGLLALRVGLTLGIAAVSYRFLEMPIRHGAIERAWDRWQDKSLMGQARAVAPIVLVAPLVGLGVGVIANARPVTADATSVGVMQDDPGRVVRVAPRKAMAIEEVASEPVAKAQVVPTQTVLPVIALASAPPGLSAPLNDSSNTPALVAEPVVLADETPADNGEISQEPLPALPLPVLAAGASDIAPGAMRVSARAAAEVGLVVDPPLPSIRVNTRPGDMVLAVGDSVLLGASGRLKSQLPGVEVHATVGWQAAQVLETLRALAKDASLRPIVVVHLGTNGYVREEQLREILNILRGCDRVVLVNSHVPRRWMNDNNRLIERVTPDFPNVAVMHWDEVSENQTGYFGPDAVHLTGKGMRAFVDAILLAGNMAPEVEKASSMEHVTLQANAGKPQDQNLAATSPEQEQPAAMPLSSGDVLDR